MKTTTIVTTDALQKGDIFTIAGCGIGSKGQTVINGRNVKTGRKCKPAQLTNFVVKKSKKSGADIGIYPLNKKAIK